LLRHEDRLDCGCPAGLEHAVDRREIGPELVGADRLEHLDRDDLAERPLHAAVVLFPDVDAQAGGSCPREPRLLVRDREPGHAAAARRGCVLGEAAPPAADLEHVVAGPEGERLAQALVLRPLRVGERLARVLEHGAGVRHRLVEHQCEELVPEVVVVGDVAT
jgi:hypothetical protein